MEENKQLTNETEIKTSVSEDDPSQCEGRCACLRSVSTDPFMMYRIWKQTSLVLIFISVGFYNGIIGVTLPDLRDQLRVLQEEIAIILMGKSVGFMTGAIIGGFLFRIFYKKADVLILLALVLSILALGCMPLVRSLALLVVMTTLVGIAEGIKNAGVNTMVLQLWGDKAATPMNILHCGVGLGSFIAPQVVSLFLGDHVSLLEYTLNRTANGNYSQYDSITDSFGQLKTYSNGGSPIGTSENQTHLRGPVNIIKGAISITAQNVSNLDKHGHGENLTYNYDLHNGEAGIIYEPGLQTAYLVICSLMTVTALVHLVLVLKGPPKDFPLWTPNGRMKQMASPGSCADGNTCYSIQLLTLLFFFYLFTDGTVKSFCNFLFSFATEGNLKMHRKEASNLNSAFWIFYMGGRAIGAPLTAVLPVPVFLLISCAGNVIISVVFSLYGATSQITMWVCTCLFGMTTAVMIPNGLAWANMYLQMNSMATMVLLVGHSTGGLSFQACAGIVYDLFGPDTVKYVSAFGTVCLFIVFIVMQTVGHFKKKTVKENEKEKMSSLVNVNEDPNMYVTATLSEIDC